MPSVTFTSPEVARIGRTERELKAQGVPYDVTLHDLAELDRAIIDDARSGFVKLLTQAGRDKLIGATVVAPRAGEMLSEVVLAMTRELGLKSILSAVHAYPTYSEAIRDGAGQWRRRHAPRWARPLLSHFHRWRRG
jgi:pyruvate/2-oxoglutarate dehydrogenase complex dihydrolipoamide dehydrogenase (E3) component